MIESIEQFDAVVIGGGVIGCSIAWRLGQAGMRVAILERGSVGEEATRAAGGILSPLAEADRADDFFHLCVASRAMYAEFARELRELSGIDIEYRTEGIIYLALTEEDEEELDRRWQWQHRAGLNVKRLNAECVRKLEPHVNEKLRWALKFPDDHQVNNLRLAKALEVAAKSSNVTFLTHTEATSLLFDGHSVRGVKTQRNEIGTELVIIAAGSWSTQRLEPAQTQGFQIVPVRGQMLAIEMPTPPIRHVIYSGRGYLVPRLSGYLIAGSTTEHVGYDKRVTAGGINSIIQRAIEIAPGLTEQAMIETWAGLRPKASSADDEDDWPVLGESPHTRGLIYATGHYRNGILLTPITAKAISELVLRGESSFDIQAFSPKRFTFHSDNA